MSGAGTLEAATQDRKARLAALRGLKRKQPEPSDESAPLEDSRKDNDADKDSSDTVTKTYLSGRNYDTATRGPKLGFENNPDANRETLETKAARLDLEHKEAAAREAAEESKEIDLFKLQPKKPNWDLKRDLKERMEVLDVRTKNAIARLVRQRLEGAKERGKESSQDGELLGQVHQREREMEEEMRREKEDEIVVA